MEHFVIKHYQKVTITYGAEVQEYPAEAWSTALILAPVVNGTNGRFKEPNLSTGSGSMHIAFIKALRAGFGLSLREAKFLLDAAQQEDAERRLNKVLEPNEDASNE